MAKELTLSLNEDQLAIVRLAFVAADKLCSAVISGEKGQMMLALDFARALSDVRRKTGAL